MNRLAAILAMISKCLGAMLITAAVLALAGYLLPPDAPRDDVAAVSAVALVMGAIYLVPVGVVHRNRRRTMLFLAATGFAPFLVALTAIQYALQAAAPAAQIAANLVSAGTVFLLTLCPPAALLAAGRTRRPGGG